MVTKRPKGAAATGRTTPKGGAQKRPAPRVTGDPGEAPASTRYTPPTAAKIKGPSRLWVPVLMFSMLGIGALIIILNYLGVFGSVNNAYLVVGLACILAGIIAATQYR